MPIFLPAFYRGGVLGSGLFGVSWYGESRISAGGTEMRITIGQADKARDSLLKLLVQKIDIVEYVAMTRIERVKTYDSGAPCPQDSCIAVRLCKPLPEGLVFPPEVDGVQVFVEN